jgi:hypothetical protein
MAMVSHWNQRFLGEMIEALEISLGRITKDDLGLNSEEAKRWELAQSWLNDARRINYQTSDEDTHISLRPFPLTGEELRALQSAVDQAALIKMASAQPDARSKIQPIVRKALAKPPVTSRVRLGRSLDRVQRSSWRLAPILGLLLAINVAEALIFYNVGSQPIPGTSVTLSALTLGVSLVLSTLAVGMWWFHHHRILSHMQLFHGSRSHALKVPVIAGLLQALGL